MSSKITHRTLILDGEDGSVGCKIHGHQQLSTIPRFSSNGTLECATRSLLRMKNLVAVRGTNLENSMIGPSDYYGNLEDAHLHKYVISNKSNAPPPIQIKPHASLTIDVKFEWISGRGKDLGRVGQSLFEYPGILNVNKPIIQLPTFDARSIDLSDYNASLVRNDIPFTITNEKLDNKDAFRVVSYIFGSNYANYQVNHSGGLFLEKHQFSQTITPAYPSCGGFVTLAKVNNDIMTIIGVNIPYGWTLIVKPWSIHGDTTLKGKYLMCMTSDHISMATADTVFLRYKGKNVNIVQINDNSKLFSGVKQDEPLVIFDDYISPALKNEYKRLVFNPFSRGYYRTIKYAWSK